MHVNIILVIFLLKMDHLLCHTKICVNCFKKVDKIVTSRIVEVIRDNVYPDYNTDLLSLPTSLCKTC